MAKAAGNDDLRREAQGNITLLASKYNDFCKASGLPTRAERMNVSGFRKVKAIDISAESGIINKYKGKGLSVHSNASVSDEVRQKVEDATKRITSDFKALEKYSEPVTFGDADGGLAINKFSALTGKNEIILEEKDFSNPDDLLQKLKEDYKAKLSYDTNNIESLVAHEMGHNAHVALALKRSGLQYGNQLNHIQRTILNKEYSAISQEVYSVCFSDESLEEIQNICKKELGTSVIGNPHELIAQAFGNYYYGAKRSWLAEKVVNYFMKGLK